MFKQFYRYINALLFGEIKDEITMKINKNTAVLSPETKQELLNSVMCDNPKNFIEQVTRDDGKIPEHVKNELMASILKIANAGVNEPQLNNLATLSKSTELSPPPSPEGKGVTNTEGLVIEPVSIPEDVSRGVPSVATPENSAGEQEAKKKRRRRRGKK